MSNAELDRNSQVANSLPSAIWCRNKHSQDNRIGVIGVSKERTAQARRENKNEAQTSTKQTVSSMGTSTVQIVGSREA